MKFVNRPILCDVAPSISASIALWDRNSPFDKNYSDQVTENKEKGGQCQKWMPLYVAFGNQNYNFFIDFST